MKAIGLVVALALLAAAPVEARDYLKQDRAQSRGFSPGVVTEGGKIVWVSGQTGLIGTFELHVRDDMSLDWPLAETPTHIMTMAFDPDLDDCVTIALRDMIKLICRRTNLSREQAYTLCSLAADLRVTQVVNGNKGIHVMLEKKLLS